MGTKLGTKNQKGTVSIENHSSRIRLRWRHQAKGIASILQPTLNQTLLRSKRKAALIERDIALNCNLMVLQKAILLYGQIYFSSKTKLNEFIKR